MARKLLKTFSWLAVLAKFSSAEEHPCDGITCSNKGYCIEDRAYNRGYWCSCDVGWVGQDCSYPQPTVVCGDNRITVSIDKGIVNELQLEDDPSLVYFGNAVAAETMTEENKQLQGECRAIETEEGEYTLTLVQPFTGCGTKIIRQSLGEEYTFSNIVVWNSEINNTENTGNINRELILLDFKCIYEDEFTMAAPMGGFDDDRMAIPTMQTIKFITEHGSFAVSLNIYQDSSFSKNKEYQQAPSIPIGSYVYVQVELESTNSDELVTVLDNCFCTQTRDPSDPSTAKHYLITNRCVDKTSDPTVQIYSNGESHKSRFKYQMFKWRWSADDVYLHCEIDICNKTSEVCQASSQNGADGNFCFGSSQTRRKRDLTQEGIYDEMDVGDNLLTKGPLRVVLEESLIDMQNLEDEDSQTESTLIYLGITLAFVLIVLGVVVGTIIRKRKAQSSKLAELEKSKRLTDYRFTREAF
jgi:hypothetical protein